MNVQCPHCKTDVKLPSGLVFAPEMKGVSCPYCPEVIPADAVETAVRR